uniref:Glutathione Stransferase putative n=1 Tax=Albugo laibachii Nc14 TaxID=890382 RepID=F0W2J4_9STRA|nr:glutathione Stransferase putative [Albugo laibachii Nc14]|eukprot:CCA15280.1 glutathione Stransferase putative [Albugo laibachii Nc14]
MARETLTDEHLSATVRQRIQIVANETAKLQEKSTSLQNEMKRLKEKNLLLEAQLNQKDLTIQSLIQMTPQSNQKEEDCAVSVTEDERVEEYEKQVKDLFTEIGQLKQENQALYECLQEQKQAKTKALKAHKIAKSAVKRFQDSGYPVLLADIQSKYQQLEHRAEKLDEMLEKEKTNAQCLRSELEAVQRDREAQARTVGEKEAIIKRLESKMETLSTQLCDQQYCLDNMQIEYKLAGMEIARDESRKHEASAGEFDLLVKALAQERGRVEKLSEELQVWKSKSITRNGKNDVIAPHREDTSMSSVLYKCYFAPQVDQMDSKMSDLAQLIPLEYHHTNEEINIQANAHSIEQTSLLEQLLDRCLNQLEAVDRFVQDGLAETIGFRCA